ncbi:hypothetical protein O6H91_20G000100 [Diphasiastrum complanatum]|nr:hypothetical protein O6H91_20G000100 [Diphasiastrum complanatum]KAJ7518594.1 hypothetical protein O6H91_20G000100 [Diphasiastrum complanatum]KAJ7518598.1 hypothetical protein O6H91_20G000100 [Diphasiastrum complanatum]
MGSVAQAGVGWGGPNWAVGLPARLHDFVKTALIQQLVPPDATVCDLFCGRGTDTAKWAQVGIGCYVGVDSSASALEDAHEQWDHQGRPYPATFCEQDPRMSDLQTHLRDRGLPFDLVCCLGHLQDCFSSENMAKHLLQNVAALLKPGGYFFGTTADSSTIWIKYQKAVEGALKSGSLRANGALPRVRSELYSISFEDDRFSSFGTKYQLRFGDDGLAAQNQLLVHFPSLIRLAKECDLEYIEIQNLLDFYEDCRNTFLDALRNSCGTFVDAKGRLPNQAHDVLSLYATFVFRKVCPFPPVASRTPTVLGDDGQSHSLDIANEYHEDLSHSSPAHHQNSLHMVLDQHQPSIKRQRLASLEDEFPTQVENMPADPDKGNKHYLENKVERKNVPGDAKRNRSPSHLSSNTDRLGEVTVERCSKNVLENDTCVLSQQQSEDATICTLSTFSPHSPSYELEQDPEKKDSLKSTYVGLSEAPFDEHCSRETVHHTGHKYYLKEEMPSTNAIDASIANSGILSLVEEEGPQASSHTSDPSSWPIPPRRHRSSRSSLQRLGHLSYPEEAHDNTLMRGKSQSTAIFEHSHRLVNQAMPDSGKHDDEETEFRIQEDYRQGRVQAGARGGPHDLYSSLRFSRYARSSLPAQSQLETAQQTSRLPSLLGPGPSKALQQPRDNGLFLTEHDDSRGKITGTRTSRIHQKQHIMPEDQESRELNRSRNSSLHNVSKVLPHTDRY